MVAPRTLTELLASLRVGDARAAATRLMTALAPGQAGPGDRVIGLVWATVDLERTVAEVEAPFLPADRDRLLGGRPMRLRYGSLEVLVEEPDTEGRLAAFLSRYGEGIAGWYVRSGRPTRSGDDLGGSRNVPHGARPGRCGPSPGPRLAPSPRLGPGPTPLGHLGSLRAHELPWGPFVIAIGEG